jgi:hypothetical protein
MHSPGDSGPGGSTTQCPIVVLQLYIMGVGAGVGTGVGIGVGTGVGSLQGALHSPGDCDPLGPGGGVAAVRHGRRRRRRLVSLIPTPVRHRSFEAAVAGGLGGDPRLAANIAHAAPHDWHPARNCVVVHATVDAFARGYAITCL